MTFPPETPQDYCDYFQGVVLHAKPPDPKWGIGLKASQAWRDYCETDDVSDHSQVFISLVKILMPVRYEGSLLLGLWQQILGHVAKLPVSDQKEIWLDVFNLANQGEDGVQHNEVALKILQEWAELDKLADRVQINQSIMTEMVNKIYRYTFSGREWMAFTISIGEWFNKHMDKPSFYDLVCSKLERKADGLEAA
jgi:hypothetical protein